MRVLLRLGHAQVAHPARADLGEDVLDRDRREDDRGGERAVVLREGGELEARDRLRGSRRRRAP